MRLIKTRCVTSEELSSEAGKRHIERTECYTVLEGKETTPIIWKISPDGVAMVEEEFTVPSHLLTLF